MSEDLKQPSTWAIGDIHGAHKALKQVLERAPIKEGDTIVVLGDIADGWSEVYECVETLINLEKEGKYNMIFIKGNHDDWFNEWIKTGIHPGKSQGGKASIDSYCKHCIPTKTEDYMSDVGYRIPDEHRRFFNYQHDYYLDEKGNLFIHGGFNRHKLLKEEKDRFIFYWDRDLWYAALSFAAMIRGKGITEEIKFKIKEPLVKQVFIGHTTTTNWSMNIIANPGEIVVKRDIPCTVPINAGQIWNLDTGAGFEGVLTILNVDTKEYFQSDSVQELYPEEKGRRK